MNNMLMESFGWVATVVFLTSYLFRTPVQLRRVQALAACLWIVYGVGMKATPIIVSNAIVAVVAMVSTLRQDKPVAETQSPAS